MKNERTLVLIITSTLILALLLILLLKTEGERSWKNKNDDIGQNVEIGASLYGLHCKNCHGIRGEGIGQLGPALNDQNFFSNRLTEVGWQTTLKQYVTTTTKNGRMMGTRPIYAGNGSTAVMPPWYKESGGPLRRDQIEALADFIINWEATATGSVVLEELHFTENQSSNNFGKKGRAVFEQHCNRCHSFQNIVAREVQGPELTHIRSRPTGDKAIMPPEKFIRESVLIPACKIATGYDSLAERDPCGAVITATELSAVTDYLLH